MIHEKARSLFYRGCPQVAFALTDARNSAVSTCWCVAVSPLWVIWIFPAIFLLWITLHKISVNIHLYAYSLCLSISVSISVSLSLGTHLCALIGMLTWMLEVNDGTF